MRLSTLGTVIGIAVGHELKGYGGVSLNFNDTNAGYSIQVDGDKWFESPADYSPGGWRKPLILNAKSISYGSGTDKNMGNYNSVSAQHLADGADWMLEATIKVFTEQSFVAFTSCYPKGAMNLQGAWSVDEVISAFPAFSIGSSTKNYLGWAGIQLLGTAVSKWADFAGGEQAGIPVLVHDQNLRSVMIGPYDNFLTSVHASRNGTSGTKIFAAGIKGSISVIPENFCHTTLMGFGQGVNSTLVSFGDQLLKRSGKERVDAKKDFVLSQLGYWTDHGGYYYQTHPNFSNAEDALLAVKADAKNRSIPIQYFQWDDWWYYQYEGDTGGLMEWQPYPNVFPSGMTKWLDMPLSLYVAEYNRYNIYVNDYKFAFDDKTNHSLPVDKQFYLDMFKNGTDIGMKMFEQDFLSGINEYTSLTNNDTHTGDDWLNAMGDAAKELGVSLQYCMMQPIHTLKSTEVYQVTNGRASRDAVGVPSFHLVLGMSGMLPYSTGIWPSADNVWTSAVEGTQTRAPPLYTNIIALLVGGPYGPSDEVGKLNKTTIMQTCRDDGLLLRADKPVTMVESAFRNGFVDANPLAVWSTYSEIDGYRWGYVLGLNLNNPYPLLSSDINDFKNSTYRVFSYLSSEGMKQTTEMNAGTPFMIPACPEPGTQPPQLGHGYHVAAPLLNGGWYFLGEVGKIVSASTVRVKSVASDAATLTLQMEGVSNEVVQIGFIKPSSTSTSFFSCPTPTCSLKSCPVTIACSLSQCSCK
eukprot:TRINITY_DN721_c0_g1_i5.p1 TRINITY_DN721_c0_g1~~TRINITY_DN721_c0_g1_i5.p1  ORF type:complete len:770 (+),score=161.41 TRINITY_DN721_c0_g1_i5:67-2310(+)